jgi:hemoglobin
MKTLRRVVLTLSFLLGALAAPTPAQEAMSNSMAGGQAMGAVDAIKAPVQKKTLYQRLGGYDAIAAVTDEFVGRLVADKRFSKFFAGHSKDSLAKIRMHVIDQLCNVTGGPCLYTGRSMKASHEGLGITSEDWDASAKHLVEALDKFKVAQADKDELMAIVATLKKDIVDTP